MTEQTNEQAGASTTEAKPGEAVDQNPTVLTNGGDPSKEGTPANNQTDGKDAGQKPEDAKGDKGKDGAPDAYGDFKFPDGVEVDKAMLDKFSPVAKELGLSQDKAQKLVDLYANAAREMGERQMKVWADTQDKWVSDAKADKEYGGEKFGENIAVAKKALDAFGTPELKDALAATGAGNHPEFIRFCLRVGKAISEDKFVMPGAPAGKRDRAEILFGATTKPTS